MKQETGQYIANKSSIDSVNINAIHFNNNCSVITAKLQTSAGINNVIVPYKVDTGNNGNIMPFHMFKELFPRIISEQLAGTKLRVYN